jgi:hypothetical protein
MEILRRHRINVLKNPKARAIVLSTLALSGLISQESWAEPKSTDRDRAVQQLAQLADVRPSTITRKGLRPTDNLPGRGLKVSKQRLDELKSTTLPLIERSKGAKYWNNVGTVSLVNAEGHVRALAATHLFDYSFRLRPDVPAVNVLSVSPKEYGLALPGSSYMARRRGEKFATLTAASYRQSRIGGGPDVSLANLSDDFATGPLPTPLQKMKAFDIGTRTGKPPIAGEKVGLYSFPTGVTDRPVSSYGTYLDRVALPQITRRRGELNDIVGLNIHDAKKDPCRQGGSGSSFIARSFISGPLSFRTSFSGQHSVPANRQEYSVDSAVTRLQIEDNLHLNLDRFNVLCAYTVINNAAVNPLLKGLDINANTELAGPS